MALYIRKDDQRSKLQEEIASDLRAKAAAVGKGDDIEESNLNLEHDAHDSYLKNSESSTRMLGVWVGLSVAAIAGVIFLVVQSS